MEDYISLLPWPYSEMYQDDEKCLDYLGKLRFGGGWHICPKCRKSIRIPSSTMGKQHRCPQCHYRFYDFSGTFLDNNKLPWSKVILGAHLFVLGKSAWQTAKYLKANHKSILKLFNNIRLAIYFHYTKKRKEERIFYNPKNGYLYLRPGFARYLKGKLESYRHISPNRRTLYLKEQEFRYNERNKPGTLLTRLLSDLLSNKPPIRTR